MNIKAKATNKQHELTSKMWDALVACHDAYHSNKANKTQLKRWREVGECFIAFAVESNGYIFQTDHYLHIGTIQQLDEIEPPFFIENGPLDFTNDGLIKRMDYIKLVLHILCSADQMTDEKTRDYYEKVMTATGEILSVWSFIQAIDNHPEAA